MDSEVRAAYERLVAALRGGRLGEKFACFAEDATVADGGHWFGSLDEYRSAWNHWTEQQGGFNPPSSVETRILELPMFGDAAVLTHTIESRERTGSGEDGAEREIATIVFGRQPDRRWLIVHQHLSSLA
jgi:uncharacterized protein (TIGR02246 family)